MSKLPQPLEPLDVGWREARSTLNRAAVGVSGVTAVVACRATGEGTPEPGGDWGRPRPKFIEEGSRLCPGRGPVPRWFRH